MSDPLAGKREFKLTSDERKRILAGDHSALKRDKDPGDDVGGLVIPLVRRKAHRVVTFLRPQFSGEVPRFDEVVEAPEHRSLWVELGEPKRHRKGHWQIVIEVHDERQAARSLRSGGSSGVPREPGLRTRRLQKPKAKGVGLEKLTDEIARGYGGGGRNALDHGAVDDDDLRRLRVQADDRWAQHRQETASEEELRRQERRARNALRERLAGLEPWASSILLAEIERLIADAGELASDKAA